MLDAPVLSVNPSLLLLWIKKPGKPHAVMDVTLHFSLKLWQSIAVRLDFYHKIRADVSKSYPILLGNIVPPCLSDPRAVR